MNPKALVAQLFDLIYLILIVRILLSWFPNIDWYKQPYKSIESISEPILAPFRKLIPPLGGLDLSPIVAFLFLQIVFGVILSIL